MAPRRCKNGKVKSGPRKGHCRKHKVAARRKRPLAGAAKRAVECKGKKAGEFRSCLRGGYRSASDPSTMYGLGGMRRRRKSRR